MDLDRLDMDRVDLDGWDMDTVDLDAFDMDRMKKNRLDLNRIRVIQAVRKHGNEALAEEFQASNPKQPGRPKI